MRGLVFLTFLAFLQTSHAASNCDSGFTYFSGIGCILLSAEFEGTWAEGQAYCESQNGWLVRYETIGNSLFKVSILL